MKERAPLTVRRATGLLFAGALLASPVYAGDTPTQTSDTSAMSCERYTGSERAECESTMREHHSTSAQSTTAHTEEAKAKDSPSASASDHQDTTTQSPDRTRVSRADTDEEQESKYWDTSRDREPGEVKGADMHSAPLQDEEMREAADDDLTDPYRTGPADDTEQDESDR